MYRRFLLSNEITAKNKACGFNIATFSRNLMNSPKSVQASVTILENLHVILRKCQKNEVNNEILPLLFHALENNTNQIQVQTHSRS